MTPEQRKKAEEFCYHAKLAASATLAPAPIADLMWSALDQIDTDERLMRQAMEALTSGRNYQQAHWAFQWTDEKRACAQETQTALDALRARLGQEPEVDDERE